MIIGKKSLLPILRLQAGSIFGCATDQLVDIFEVFVQPLYDSMTALNMTSPRAEKAMSVTHVCLVDMFRKTFLLNLLELIPHKK